VGTIGNYNDKYHVTAERFVHRPGEVRLELWKRTEQRSWSSNTQRWIECPEGAADGDQRIELVAREMINAAEARDAGTSS